MRPLPATLIKAQKQPDFDSLWKIVLTKDSDTYTYDRERISLAHLESDFSQVADVVINDPDNELVSIDLQGFKGVLSYGLVLPNGVESYSATAPLWVIPQQLHSLGSGTYCRLSLVGIFNQMNADKASAAYEPDADDKDTIQALVNAIAGATLSVFSHCKAYDVVWDSLDDIVYSYQPKDMFNIAKRGSRLAAIQKLLSWSNCVPIIKADGKIHIFVPTTSGTDYDYQYELAEVDVGKHTFFAKTYRKRVVIPNYIVVESHESHAAQYSGYAEDAVSIAALADAATGETGIRKDFITLRLSSDAQATAIAEAIRDKYSLEAERGSGKVPMNAGQELYDYVNMIDGRTGDSVAGNIGYIKRVCQPAPDIEKGFSMSFGFGKMTEYNPLGLAPTSALITEGLPNFQLLVEQMGLLQEQLNHLWGNYNSLFDFISGIANYLERLRITPSQFGFRTDWESLDGWDDSGCTGTGAATTDKTGLTLDVGATPASVAKILTEKRGGVVLQFAKESVFKTVMAVSNVASDVTSWAIMGDKSIGSGYGFKLVGSTLYGYVRNISTEDIVELIDNFNADWDYILQAHYEPNVGVHFYVDNEHKATLANALPNSDNEGIHFEITTTTTANAKLYSRTAQVYTDFLSGHGATGLYLISSTGEEGRIARDSTGSLWCVYRDGASLKARKSTTNGGSWSDPETIATESYACEPDIAIDSSDVPHVVYAVRIGTITQRKLYYSRRDPVTGWTAKEDIIGTETFMRYYYPKLAVDSGGDLHCIYTNNRTSGLNAPYYIKRTSSVWGSPYLLASHYGRPSEAHDIAVDKDDYVHTIWAQRNNAASGWQAYQIIYRLYDGSWQAEEVLTNVAGNTNHQLAPRVVVDSVGDAYAVWTGKGWGANTLKYNVQYRKRESAVWQAQEAVTDKAGHQGTRYVYTLHDNLEISMDFIGQVHICWYDDLNTDIRHVQRTSGVWGAESVIIDNKEEVYSMLWAWHPEFCNLLSNGFMLVLEGVDGMSLYRS